MVPSARPLTDRAFTPTPERLARGRYLAENLLQCFACHSERDWTRHDAPIVAGHGAGSPNFPLKDLPGDVRPPNITPDKDTGAGNWTDDQLARAIREGIGYDGRALFPFMPYENFRSLSDEDLASVVVYLRSLPPVRREVPKTELIFPVRYLIRSAPQPLAEPVPEPDKSTVEKRGEYLVTIGGCRDCHTPQHRRAAHDGTRSFWRVLSSWSVGRGRELPISPRLRPGSLITMRRLFRDVMRTGWVKARKLAPIMPWWNLRGLSDDDLKSMFAYLRTVPPVPHRVDNSKPPTACKLCGFTHGAGDQN